MLLVVIWTFSSLIMINVLTTTLPLLVREWHISISWLMLSAVMWTCVRVHIAGYVEVSRDGHVDWVAVEAARLHGQGRRVWHGTTSQCCFSHHWSASHCIVLLSLCETRNLTLCSWDVRQHQFSFMHRLSWSICSNFGENSLLKCASQPKITKNLLAPPFWILRSSMLVPLERSSAVLATVSSKSVSVCNRSHSRRANSCKINILRGTLRWCPCLSGISSFSGMMLGRKKTRDSTLSYGENRSLYISPGLESVPYQVVTDRRTDRITIASTRLALRAVARENCGHNMLMLF